MEESGKIAVFAGSFDPPTLGHMDIITRAASLFESLHVVVAQNEHKTGSEDAFRLQLEERISLLEALCSPFQNIKVTAAAGLVTDYMIREGINFLVRGVRGENDLRYEMELAVWNRALNPACDTVFLPAKPLHYHISSSGVKEVMRAGGDFTVFVPEIVSSVLTKKFKLARLCQHKETAKAE